MSDTQTSGRDVGFLRRMTLATAWGEGLDGYDLGVMSVVLVLITAELGLSPLWTGLIGASTLIGIFFGAPIAGWLSDRIGRKTLFSIDIAIFVVLGLLQAVITDPWQLFVVRLLLGIAIGAEYSIGAAMLSEFAPSAGRGRRVAGLLVSWYVGFLLAVVIGYLMTAGLGLSWRWVLASCVVPAIVTLALRYGFPESPFWLLTHGRQDEARAVADRYLGGQAWFDEEAKDAKPAGEGGIGRLFAPGLRSKTIFACTFYACIVTPYFAIFTFAPQVFEALQVSDKIIGEIIANALAAIGALVGMLTIERIGRRQQLIGPFAIMTVALLVVGLYSGGSPLVIVLAFAVFAFFNALSGNLTAIYPAEIFPTDLRATGSGVATAFSRIGAAAGTFLLPIGLSTLGIAPCMLIAAGITAIGFVVSYYLAPETTGQSLSITSALGGGAAPQPA